MRELKANGKGYLIVKIKSQDKDSMPWYSLRSCEDLAEAQQWANNYFGGTTVTLQELTPEELFQERSSTYWKGYEEAIDDLAQNADQNFVDCYMNEFESLQSTSNLHGLMGER